MVGFAPTMGALHPGHLSLIEKSKSENEVTVASIFVNPTQFNDPKDFEKYPVTISNDCKLLEAAGTDILFLPSVAEMYPGGTLTKTHYDLGLLETVLDGAFRPGHFQGVCQVVQRLLEIVEPDQLYIGQKDFQQCMVLKRLVSIMGIATKINIVPTLREADGLAMSSRNLRLTAEERNRATSIYRQLIYIQENVHAEKFATLKKNAANALLAAGFTKVDYVEIADANTLQILEEEKPGQRLVALIAAFNGDVRLIDNMILS